MAFICAALTAAFIPQTSEQLIQSYLFWLAVFVTVNVVWDIASPKTPQFHIARFREKVSVAVGSTSFCSGVLILTSSFNEVTRQVVGSTPATLVIAAAASLFLSIPYLCPHDGPN